MGLYCHSTCLSNQPCHVVRTHDQIRFMHAATESPLTYPPPPHATSASFISPFPTPWSVTLRSQRADGKLKSPYTKSLSLDRFAERSKSERQDRHTAVPHTSKYHFIVVLNKGMGFHQVSSAEKEDGFPSG